MRQAVGYAINREGISKVACLGYCPPAGVIVPRVMEFALQVPPFPYDPKKAKQLLAEAGHPNGFDAGLFHAIPGFPTAAEAVVNDLNAAGIRVRLRADGAGRVLRRLEGAQIPRPVHDRRRRRRQRRDAGSKASCIRKAAMPRAVIPISTKSISSRRRSATRRSGKQMLHKIQQLTIDRMMFAPIYDFRALMGVGPRVVKDTIGDIYLSPWPAYEDIEMKAS